MDFTESFQKSSYIYINSFICLINNNGISDVYTSISCKLEIPETIQILKKLPCTNLKENICRGKKERKNGKIFSQTFTFNPQMRLIPSTSKEIWATVDLNKQNWSTKNFWIFFWLHSDIVVRRNLLKIDVPWTWHLLKQYLFESIQNFKHFWYEANTRGESVSKLLQQLLQNWIPISFQLRIRLQLATIRLRIPQKLFLKLAQQLI